MEKTKVRIISQVFESGCSLKFGDIGYIDGYINGGDGRPYAVVVVANKIDLIPINALEVIQPLKILN